MFGKPKIRKDLFDNFISEFNRKFEPSLELSEDEKSDFLNRLLSRNHSKAKDKGKFISTFYYPRIVDIRDIEENRDIEISTPIPISMEKLLQDFYEILSGKILESKLKSGLELRFHIFPLILKGEKKTFQVIKIEPYQDGNFRNPTYIVYFKPENEDITIQVTFNHEIKYPYFITLNGNEYEIGENNHILKNDNKRKSLIENNRSKIKRYLQILKNYRMNLGNLNNHDFYKEIFPETNNPCLEDLDVRIDKLENKLQEEKKQLEDINIVNTKDKEKIEELHDAITNSIRNPIFGIREERIKIMESLKKLLYFQFIENLSNYYYGENRDQNISEKIQELVSILTENSSVKNTYPNTLVPSLTNQLKYLTKKKESIQQTSSQEFIQLTSTLSINTVVNNIKNNQLKLSNLNNIDMIFKNIEKYLYLTFAFDPYFIFGGFKDKEKELKRIEIFFKEKYQ